ncbi:putative ribonuclease h protein [Fagus crenata]
MGDIAVNYFEGMFSRSTDLEWEATVGFIDRVVTPEMNRHLLAPFTAIELKVEWVFDLIDGVRGTWNLLVLCELFDADSVDKIKQISLRDTRGPDSFSWKLNSIGVFTVKTAYNLVVSPEVRGVEGENSNRTQHRQFWRVLWKLKIPHKVKIHLWRAYLNVLPTRLSLCRRRVLSEPTCPIYNAADKTTTHAIWSCPYAGSVWAFAPSFFQNMPSVDIDFFLLSCKIFRDTSRKHIEIWAVTS